MASLSRTSGRSLAPLPNNADLKTDAVRPVSVNLFTETLLPKPNLGVVAELVIAGPSDRHVAKTGCPYSF